VTEGAPSPEEIAAENRLDGGHPPVFFDQHGLRTTVLVDAVTALGPVEPGDGGELFWYGDGYWQKGGERIVKSRAYALLGDSYRMMHGSTVVDVVKARDPVLSYDRCDTRYLNLPNGLLDWRTGGHPGGHDPAVLSRNRIPVQWDEQATCPLTQEWMRQMLAPDCIPLAEEIMGLALYDGNPFHKAVLLHGAGRNGKGTWLRLVTALAGKANICAVPPQKLDEDRFAAAELAGKLANIVGDVDPRMFKVTEVFKKATGEDMLYGERKYAHPFHFTSRALMMFSFNQLPATADMSSGYFSRWLVLPFPNVIAKPDPGIERRMHEPAELEGLLVLAVRGLRRLMERGHFEEPDTAIQAREEFMVRADQVRAFIDDMLTQTEGGWLPRMGLYTAYASWAAMNQHLPVSAQTFYERLKLAGCQAKRSKNERGFAGLSWKHQSGGR
jgi:P4 family phage/plasmid primase-like protien